MKLSTHVVFPLVKQIKGSSYLNSDPHILEVQVLNLKCSFSPTRIILKPISYNFHWDWIESNPAEINLSCLLYKLYLRYLRDTDSSHLCVLDRISRCNLEGIIFSCVDKIICQLSSTPVLQSPDRTLIPFLI